MRHVAHVAHHSRGRLRIRVPSAKGKPEALETIRRSLMSLNGVDEVAVNLSIGSITIHYDPNAHPDFQQHLVSGKSEQDAIAVAPPPRLEDLADVDEMLRREAEFLARHSDSAKALFDWINAMDSVVRRATNNAIDFKVLAPLALAVGALMELGVTASTPVWLTMGLFSFNHFIELHSSAQRSAPPGQIPTDAASPSGSRQKRAS